MVPLAAKTMSTPAKPRTRVSIRLASLLFIQICACRASSGVVGPPLASGPIPLTTQSSPSLPPLPDVGAPLSGPLDGMNDAAVIVAIENYNFDLAPIPGALKNAEDWKNYLLNVRGVPRERVQYLVDRHATDDSIRSAIRELGSKIPRTGRLWFVFIGHGAPGHDAKGGFLVGVDAQAEVSRLVSRSISHGELIKLLSAAGGEAVAVLDTCFSGRDPQGEWLLRGIQPSIPVSTPKPRPRGRPRLLILAAGTSDQFAGQLAHYARPAFSYLLLGALRGWADHDHDTIVTASEAIDYTRDVLSATLSQSRSQTPTLIGAGATALARSNEPDPGIIARLTSSSHSPPITTPVPVANDCGSPHFGPNWPPLDFPIFTGGLIAANPPIIGSIKSDIALSRATNAQAEGRIKPMEVQKAWCDLAAIETDNPYLQGAQSNCAQWTRYNSEILWMSSDYRCLDMLLSSSAPEDERVHYHLTQFMLRYGGLTWRPEVAQLKERAPVHVEEILVGPMERIDYYLDRAPVSLAAYKRCMRLGPCTERTMDSRALEKPKRRLALGLGMGGLAAGVLERIEHNCSAEFVAHRDKASGADDQPVTCVSPRQAKIYCAWAGKRLPRSGILSIALDSARLSHDGIRYFIAEDEQHEFKICQSGKFCNILNKYPADQHQDTLGFRCARELSRSNQIPR